MAARVHSNKPGDQLLLHERRQRVAQMYIRGMSQVAIAEKEGISQSGIALDLKFIREQWLESMLTNYDEKVARELAKIDNLEQAAWNAWERSMEDAVTLTANEKQELRAVVEASINVADPKAKLPILQKLVITQKDSKEQRTGQVGDPRFLEVIRGCIGDRRKLMGLDAEKESDGKGVTVINVNWDGMTGRSKIVDPVELRKMLPPPPAPEVK